MTYRPYLDSNEYFLSFSESFTYAVFTSDVSAHGIALAAVEGIVTTLESADVVITVTTGFCVTTLL